MFKLDIISLNSKINGIRIHSVSDPYTINGIFCIDIEFFADRLGKTFILAFGFDIVDYVDVNGFVYMHELEEDIIADIIGTVNANISKGIVFYIPTMPRIDISYYRNMDYIEIPSMQNII